MSKSRRHQNTKFRHTDHATYNGGVGKGGQSVGDGTMYVCIYVQYSSSTQVFPTRDPRSWPHDPPFPTIGSPVHPENRNTLSASVPHRKARTTPGFDAVGLVRNATACTGAWGTSHTHSVAEIRKRLLSRRCWPPQLGAYILYIDGEALCTVGARHVLRRRASAACQFVARSLSLALLGGVVDATCECQPRGSHGARSLSPGVVDRPRRAAATHHTTEAPCGFSAGKSAVDR